MIKLPEIPYELLDTLSSAEVPLVRAYALRAIREFVEGKQPVAWASPDDAGEPCMLFPTIEEAACFCDDDEQPIPLIIKPELDDAKD